MTTPYKSIKNTNKNNAINKIPKIFISQHPAIKITEPENINTFYNVGTLEDIVNAFDENERLLKSTKKSNGT